MYPAIYGVEAVANEIVAERNRRILRGQLLRELPPAPPRATMIWRMMINVLGSHLVEIGERLRRYGQTPVAGKTWVVHAQGKKTTAWRTG